MKHHVFSFLFLFVLMGCNTDNEALLETILPCEDAFKKYLEPHRTLTNFETHEIDFFEGSKFSKKFLVIPCAIRSIQYGYMVLNNETEETNFIEITKFSFEYPLSLPHLFQIHEETLYLALNNEIDRWRFVAINLSTLQEREISLEYEGSEIKEILQVEVLKDDIYVLSEYDDFSAILKISTIDDGALEFRKFKDDKNDSAFKVMQLENSPPFYLRLSQDKHYQNTIVQKFNLNTHDQEFIIELREGLDEGFRLTLEKVHMHSDGTLYINMLGDKGAIIDVKNNTIIKEIDQHMIVINDKYAIAYTTDDKFTKNEKIVTKGGISQLYKADWERSFYSFISLNEKYLLIERYRDFNILNLETGCIEYKVEGNTGYNFWNSFYKTSEDEFVLLYNSALRLFKI